MQRQLFPLCLLAVLALARSMPVAETYNDIDAEKYSSIRTVKRLAELLEDIEHLNALKEEKRRADSSLHYEIFPNSVGLFLKGKFLFHFCSHCLSAFFVCSPSLTLVCLSLSIDISILPLSLSLCLSLRLSLSLCPSPYLPSASPSASLFLPLSAPLSLSVPLPLSHRRLPLPLSSSLSLRLSPSAPLYQHLSLPLSLFSLLSFSAIIQTVDICR